MQSEFFLTADKRFYEPADARPGSHSDFADLVDSKLGPGWKTVRRGVWTNCRLDGTALPRQGWKIHLSSVPADARRLLEAVVGPLVARRTAFKFLADAAMLRMTGSKSWGRGGSGKFITVYPTDEADFRALLAELDALTRGFRGPYILSDRRYRDNKVLYYRYGGILPSPRLQEDGRTVQVLTAPDGREIEDVRGPLFAPPAWAKDPFPAESPAGRKPLGGRYTVERALSFSNTGGVYLAVDGADGKRVVLKEARAHVHGFYADRDAADMLRHEAAVLERLADLAVAPKPLGLFTEWEHLFLAEEYLEGYVPLKKLLAQPRLFLDTRPTEASAARHLARDLALARRLAAVVDALHARGVTWGDLSPNNVLVRPEDGDVRIIDLESCHISGQAPRGRVMTAGYAPAGTRPDEAPTEADDYYALGAVMLCLLTNCNGLLGLKPEAKEEFLAQFERDFGVPTALSEAVLRLTDPDPSRRPQPSEVLSDPALDAIGKVAYASVPRRSTEDLVDSVTKTRAFISAAADPARTDRLFPADPMLYQTNPVGLAHGATGVLLALHETGGTIPPEWLDWVEGREASARTCPPGLQQGLSGTAWALLSLGRERAARAALEAAASHPLLGNSMGLYHGLAGWGLANLRFWRVLGESRFLAAAERAGTRLLATARRRDGGLCWPEAGGSERFGLAYGSSGIALFLAELGRADGDMRFLASSEEALAYDAARLVETAPGVLALPRGTEDSGICSPYLRQGSAGVGAAAVRVFAATGSAESRATIARVHADCDRKYTLFPGRENGLSGIGEFLLDAHVETGDERFLDSAHRAAAGLSLFQVDGADGRAYPGDGLARLSCDLATGAAGAALFLDRLSRPRRSALLWAGR